MIRQSLYIPVTTAKVEMYMIEGINGIFRVVPNEAVRIDIDGRTYIWVLTEADDIGEKYFYAEQTFIEILAQDEIYTGIRGVMDGTTVIVTSASELGHGTRVKISGEYEK
jgi:hypothetical protein